MKPSDSISRRQFVTTSASVLGTFAIVSNYKAHAVGANEKVVIGLMGCGGRGTYVAKMFAERPDVDFAYICDVDTRRFSRARDQIEEAQGKPPKAVQDFRKMLDDKRVDAIINATPDHWHALGSIMACQAGKDVYVE